MLDITYDPEADAAYISLGRGKIAETGEVAPGIVLDYDDDGRVVGIEVLDASKVLAPGDWAKARGPGRSSAPDLPRLSPGERARLVAEAQDLSRRLRNSPGERALMEELEAIQADNADALR